jgi:hypothetical protein
VSFALGWVTRASTLGTWTVLSAEALTFSQPGWRRRPLLSSKTLADGERVALVAAKELFGSAGRDEVQGA